MRQNGLQTIALVIALAIAGAPAQAGLFGGDAGKFLREADRTARKAGRDADRAVREAGRDADRKVREAGRKIDREKNRAGENVEEAVHVVGKTVERSAHAVGEAAEAAGERLEEGKPLDAVWHFETDLLKAQEEIALKATQESTLLRTGAQVAATAYGGPAGAAAYTAWYVGRTTGDLETGLRAGAVAGASSYLTTQIGAQPVGGFEDGVTKAISSGSVGGVAATAVGGDFEDGFRSAALASAAHSVYTAYTGHTPDARPGENPPMAKGNAAECADIASCNVVETGDDMRALSPRTNHVGKVSTTPNSPPSLAHEGSGPMRAANLVPGINAGAYVHDIWATEADMNSFELVATIPPAMIGTYTALGVGRDAALLDSAIEAHEGRASAEKSESEEADVSADRDGG